MQPARCFSLQSSHYWYTRMDILWGQGSHQSCFPFISSLQWCLAYMGQAVNLCWIKEWLDPAQHSIYNLFSKEKIFRAPSSNVRICLWLLQCWDTKHICWVEKGTVSHILLLLTGQIMWNCEKSLSWWRWQAKSTCREHCTIDKEGSRFPDYGMEALGSTQRKGAGEKRGLRPLAI